MINLDVCICEPFMLAGALPTLAPAIIKTALENNGYKTKIFYPSIEFFYENKIMQDKEIIRLIDDIPLQIVDFFFTKKANMIFELKKSVNPEMLTESVVEKLLIYREALREKIVNLAETICMYKPRILCCSLTFGGIDFVEALFHEVKKRDENIISIVGGSNCTIEFSKKILTETSSIQYVICDETTDSLVQLVDALIHHKTKLIDSVSDTTKIATRHTIVENLDEVNCPDFDDYFDVIKIRTIYFIQILNNRMSCSNLGCIGNTIN